jgi:hypothetical protein
VDGTPERVYKRSPDASGMFTLRATSAKLSTFIG